MKNNLMTLLGYAVLTVCISVSSFVAGQTKEKKEQDDLRKAAVTEVIIANTTIMQESESVFQRLKNNSDTMMRYSHYLDGHDPTVKREPFCPECAKEIPEDISKHFINEHEDEEEEVPETFEQLLRDCRELADSVGRIDSSLYSQSVTLERNLKKLSDGTFITLKEAK
tara:strand:- start:2734 stop:3237 length:504 start_codon:yes stop_codon:yes gene_type:complete